MAAPTCYLDHAATSPMRPEAREELLRWSDGVRGNPSGSHRLARAARRALDDARDRLAEALGCGPGDVVFTSGGTEADNLAIFGAAEAARGVAGAAEAARGVAGAAEAARGVACSAAEHHAVLDPVLRLGGLVLPVDGLGRLDPDRVAACLPVDTAVVSVMLANNEVGTVNDLAALADAVATRTDGRAVLHTDAVAAFCWVDVAEAARSAAMVSVSAHKFGGPVGVGALVVRPGVALRARLLGGGQERERRSGTPSVAAVSAMAAAAAATVAERPASVARVGALRDGFVDRVRAALPGVHETVPDRAVKVAANAHLCFEGVASEELLFVLDDAGLCASAASSCASGALQRSHVLAAMGVEPSLARGAVRFTFGWCSTEDDVEMAVTRVVAALRRLRSASR